MMDQVFLIALILLLGSALQGALGFAMGLFSIPLLMGAGATLPQAITLVMVGSTVLSLTAVRELRAHIPWREVVSASFFRTLSIPLGVWALGLLSGLSQHTIEMTVGAAILVAVGIQAFGRPPSQDQVERLRVPACLTSGFTLGMLGMGGPPLVLWVMATGWESARTRAFLLAVYLVCLPVTLAILVMSLGQSVFQAMLMGIAFSPVVLLGGTIGLRLGNLVSKNQLRLAALSLLSVIGVNSLL